MESAGYYVGPLGGLIWIPDAVGRLVTTPADRRESERFAVTGARRVWRSPLARRAWQVEVPECEPFEFANLLGLVRRGQPVGWWVEPLAATHNLTPPAWADGNGGGMLVGPDGTVHQRSYTWSSATSIEIARGVPVCPGVPVTFSAYVLPVAGMQGLFWAQYLDAAGATVGATLSAKTVTSNPAVQRVSATLPLPPVNAVQVRVGQMNCQQVAGIAVTWTKAITSWIPGGGCDKAYVTDLAHDVVEVTEDKGRATVVNVSFKVLEVG